MVGGTRLLAIVEGRGCCVFRFCFQRLWNLSVTWPGSPTARHGHSIALVPGIATNAESVAKGDLLRFSRCYALAMKGRAGPQASFCCPHAKAERPLVRRKYTVLPNSMFFLPRSSE